MPPERKAQEGRDKLTIWLLTGGAVSLLLPLLGIIYIRMGEAKAARTPNSSVMFDRHEDARSQASVSQAVPSGRTTPPAPASSLDFLKGGANSAYFQDKPATAPAASTPTSPAPAAVPEPESPPKTTAKKGGNKAFNRPKLQGTSGFGTFTGSSPKPSGGQGMAGVADPQAGKASGDMADMLKNVPGGTDNPEVQKYLKSRDQ